MNDEDKVKNIFANLKTEAIAPHSFLKTRTLAVSKELIEARKSNLYWKLFSALTTCALVLTIFVQQTAPKKPMVAANSPYVIHMTFSEEEAQEVAVAEVTLPEDVTFHSEKNPKIAELRTLRLPLKANHNGRTKLPFVVLAKGQGNRKIQVRLLDLNNNLIKQNFIKVSFNQRG